MTAYNPALHHVGLGPAGSQKGYTVSGGYRKDLQREASPMEFGGTFDLESSPGHSRWTQEDFSGGQYQYIWGKDPAMFRSCMALRPLMFERTLVTVPPMKLGRSVDNMVPNYWPGTIPAGGPTPAFVPKPLLTYNIEDYIYTLWPEEINSALVNLPQKLTKYHYLGTVAPTVVSLANVEALTAAYDRADGILYVSNEVNRRLDRWKPVTGAAAAPASYAYPTGISTRPLVHMNADGPNITCIFGRMIADLTVPDDVTTAVPASSKYWVVNKRYRLPGRVVDSLYYNSTLYLLVGDAEWDRRTRRWVGGWNTWIFSWNGADLLPVVHFPYTFRGSTIVEYAGRIFVGGYGVDFNSQAAYGELYEIQASSIRAVRSFATEHRSTSGAQIPATKNIDQLVVWEGLLWFVNESAECVECYDITTDAFYCGPSIEPVTALGHRSDALIPVNSTMCVVSSGGPQGSATGGAPAETGDFLSYQGSWYIPNSGAADVMAELVTSDFCVEPSLKKVWNTFTVLTKGGEVSAVKYSIDGGETFSLSSLPPTDDSMDGDWIVQTFDASGIPSSERCCFKIEMNRTIAAGFTELVAFTALFNFVSTGKKVWNFSIWAVDKPETVDGNREQQNVATISADLFGYAESNEPLAYTDVNGDVHSVRLIDVQETLPVIASKLGAEGGSNHEAVYAVTLLEI